MWHTFQHDPVEEAPIFRCNYFCETRAICLGADCNVVTVGLVPLVWHKWRSGTVLHGWEDRLREVEVEILCAGHRRRF